MIDAIREKTLKRLFDYITQDFEIWKRVQRPFSKLCHKDGLFIKKKKKKTQQNEVWIEPILSLMLLSKFVFFLRQGHNFEHNYSPVSQHW